MAFAAATKEKVGRYLGFPVTSDSADEIGAALGAVEGMSDGTYSAAAIAAVEGWITQLDAIYTAIDTQRETEGSTILPELRREGRRYVTLIANALNLDIRMDVFGTSGV